MLPSTPPETLPESVSGVVEQLFRQQSGRLIAALTRVFGVDRLQLAEDVMQESLLKALQTWPYHGVPSNPAAWILSVARNLALDIIRREHIFSQKESELTHQTEQARDEVAALGGFSEDEIRDDQLRMMFTCCHPSLSQDIQVALTLKTLCGFGVPEIAAAFLSSEASIAKRLVRARQKLREARAVFEVPSGNALSTRLDAVLQALYLLFNEGYKASQGDALVRHDLCREAIRLVLLVVQHRVGDQPRAHALLALMLFNAARLDTRIGDNGQLQLLADQDRSRWNQALIALAIEHLAKSGQGAVLTEFHFEAGIAACHCTAPSAEDTNWSRILQLYDGLLSLKPSPVVVLNRAVAFSKVNGVKAALQLLKPLDQDPGLQSYYLLPAVRAHFMERLGDKPAARLAYQEALKKCSLGLERSFLEQSLSRI